GEAVRERDRGARRRRLRADPRRVRLREGLSRREVLPRRQAHDDRRRDERDPAARHRAPAPVAMTASTTFKLFSAGSTRFAVIAVDPTSPFSGGAVLGDRLRMQAHAQDEGVFIRSMATRGHLGGLARATGDAALVLDAAGTEIIIIETVGVGQDEVDIIRTAD